MTIVKPLPHDLAVKARLATLGRPVGFGAAPPGALAALKTGGPDYFILTPISSIRDGSLGDPWSDAAFNYQIDCVGRLADGVRWMVGEIEAVLLGVVVASRTVAQVVPLNDGAVTRDDDVDPPIFTARPEYSLHTVPT